jgi:hypothetical protein
LPPAVYWRRRILVFGIPLVLVAVTAYACSGSGGGNGARGGAGAGPSSSSAIITPGAVPTGTLPPINSYPVTGPTGSGAPTATAGGGNGALGGGAVGGSVGGSLGGSVGGSTGGSGSVGGVPVGSTGCVLAVQVQLDKTSQSGPPAYGPGQDPVFNVILRNQGSGNCRLDVSGKGVVVTVTSVDTNTQVWSTANCNTSHQDLRVLGPGDGYTGPVQWSRVQSRSNCALTPQPAGAGSYAVTAMVSGVTAASVQFTLQ